MAAYLQELFQFNLYKKSQGRYARQATLFTILVVVAYGVWCLAGWLESEGASNGTVVGVPLTLMALFGWAAYRLIQFPMFADFLIAVEAEMSKVSWPTWSELIRASMVVIFVIFFLAALLFFYDWLLKGLLSGVFFEWLWGLLPGGEAAQGQG